HSISSDHAFDIDGQVWNPILVYHHKLPVLGFRVEDFTYITDANRIPAQEWPKLEGTKVLVLNALRKEAHISHFTLEEALEVIERVNPERAYLTHISHQMGKHAEISAALPDNVFIAEDQLQIVI
ncbi:MAG: MBL fold metallo-hydrolase, partial [Cryomorphaceae bacterium]